MDRWMDTNKTAVTGESPSMTASQKTDFMLGGGSTHLKPNLQQEKPLMKAVRLGSGHTYMTHQRTNKFGPTS